MVTSIPRVAPLERGFTFQRDHREDEYEDDQAVEAGLNEGAEDEFEEEKVRLEPESMEIQERKPRRRREPDFEDAYDVTGSQDEVARVEDLHYYRASKPADYPDWPGWSCIIKVEFYFHCLFTGTRLELANLALFAARWNPGPEGRLLRLTAAGLCMRLKRLFRKVQFSLWLPEVQYCSLYAGANNEESQNFLVVSAHGHVWPALTGFSPHSFLQRYVQPYRMLPTRPKKRVSLKQRRILFRETNFAPLQLFFDIESVMDRQVAARVGGFDADTHIPYMLCALSRIKYYRLNGNDEKYCFTGPECTEKFVRLLHTLSELLREEWEV